MSGFAFHLHYFKSSKACAVYKQVMPRYPGTQAARWDRPGGEQLLRDMGGERSMEMPGL